MNKVMEFEALKEQWKNQKTEAKYSQTELLAMLNRKSIHNVKYILIISIIEFCLGLFSLIYLHFANNNSISEQNRIPSEFIKEIENFSQYYIVYDIIYVLLFVFFIYKFYTYYQKLCIYSSIKDYIIQIIDFRKWVNYFIYFNILLFFLVFISVLFFAMYEAIKIYEGSSPNANISSISITIGILITCFLIFILGGVVWLYYKLVYGMFLKKLKINLHELEKLDA